MTDGMSTLEFSIRPALPARRVGELKDLAQEVAVASASLEGQIADSTARALGDCLRYLNSYYSNLIEGHKTSILEIDDALNKKFSPDQEKRYAQELCAAHVLAEKELMEQMLFDPPDNVCSLSFVCRIHRTFYENLPQKHRYTHNQGGFTAYDVHSGQLRDGNVSLDDGYTVHGPDASILPQKFREFEEAFNQSNFHGDERLMAAAAAHHRLTWLHPFRDGNGRVSRLFSGLYLACIGVNRSNLWSLSRGFSRDKQWYMVNLRSADSPNVDCTGFDQDFFADYCMFFLETCLDQIRFMDRILSLKRIDARIDGYMRDRAKERGAQNPLDARAGKLFKALFMQGEIQRGKARDVMGMEAKSERQARRIVSQMVKEGLVQSDSHKAPLRIAFPTHVLRFYFPDLFDPSVLGKLERHTD
ncbi:MAG: Fic family protein [Desulfovermiculus sp.]|nr:Fic family protein [Desulfovermiculus sp.]